MAALGRPTTAERLVELHNDEELVALRFGKCGFRGKQQLLGFEHDPLQGEETPRIEFVCRNKHLS